MILVSLSSLNLEFLTYPPAPITHQTQGSLGSNPTALPHQCRFTSSAWPFHCSEFSPSLWFHVTVCTCSCSWHSAPCNRNCLHLPSPKYPAPLLCLPQFTPTAPAVCLGTWSPWPLPQVTWEGPRRSGTQWCWLPGRSVLLFRAFVSHGPCAGGQRDQNCMSVSLLISKEKPWKTIMREPLTDCQGNHLFIVVPPSMPLLSPCI